MSSLDSLPSDLSRDRLLKSNQTAEFLGISLPHLRRLQRSGAVPRPVRIGLRQYGWRLGELIDFIDKKAASAGG
jgi:predicted DNA-binding transcriptional regulator AlpA